MVWVYTKHTYIQSTTVEMVWVHTKHLLQSTVEMLWVHIHINTVYSRDGQSKVNPIKPSNRDHH